MIPFSYPKHYSVLNQGWDWYGEEQQTRFGIKMVAIYLYYKNTVIPHYF